MRIDEKILKKWLVLTKTGLNRSEQDLKGLQNLPLKQMVDTITKVMYRRLAHCTALKIVFQEVETLMYSTYTYI